MNRRGGAPEAHRATRPVPHGASLASDRTGAPRSRPLAGSVLTVPDGSSGRALDSSPTATSCK